GGIVLPEDCNVITFIYGCHHNPKFFPEPEKFVPERFERDEIPPFAFLPFGAGPRICIGKKYSMIEMKCCISKIVRKFHLIPAIPEHKLELVPEFTLKSKNGIKISLEKRWKS
ncbi:putative cytochrome P450 4d14, partial [Gonioctena quinquepunctata]